MNAENSELKLEQIQEASTAIGGKNPASSNLKKDIVSQLCGFDPFDLLLSVDFPNDRFERLLRVSKEARLLALRLEDIPVSDFETELLSSSTRELQGLGPIARNAGQSCSTNLLATVLDTTTKFLLDTKEGIKVESIANQSTSEAIVEAKEKEKELLREQLSKSAAAIMIQSCARGYLVRKKFVSVVYAKLTVNSHDTDSSKIISELPQVLDLTIQEKVIRKFKAYCQIFEIQQKYVPDYPQFAAAKIQATFRRHIFHKMWKSLYSMPSQEKMSLPGQEAKAALLRKSERADFRASTYISAILKIQTTWKNYSAKKIFRFYRDLIKFREAGNPSMLLKYVNPKESKLIDGASGIHVRFRLGGVKFPPTIYYKIFLHNKLVDLNAFSPRDYTKHKKALPRTIFNKNRNFAEVEDQCDGWYERRENNGWRAIIERSWIEEQQDDIVTQTAAKSVRFHHLKLKRQQEIEKMRKSKKLDWMRKLYEEGKKLALSSNQNQILQSENSDEFPVNTVKAIQTTSEYTKLTTEEDILQAMAELETELEHEFLLKWSEALDFDTYNHDWLQLSTTGKSDDLTSYAARLIDVPFIGKTNNNNNHSSTRNSKNEDENHKDMMAEIDLFKKIAAESGIKGRDNHSDLSAATMGIVDDSKKPRPWSGRSSHSLNSMFLRDFNET
ncbi:hypothetical protein HK100_012198 [Physocladia obscura]|uniref:Uncharacterized protein n=1 Tax=Physocladia obscura TaxID=109957 RepID=A0AAD5T026_9FUNG|nr:hypothetical protein HK100_012198 [Physocladia obscura]